MGGKKRGEGEKREREKRRGEGDRKEVSFIAKVLA